MDEKSLFIDAIEGKGATTVSLGKMSLAPGIYMANISVWDKAFIRPYIVRHQDIIRIEVNGRMKQSSSILMPDIEWKVALDQP